jgi:exopolysaccharide biosynthesis polyprenyl glycosylphosphotransferase
MAVGERGEALRSNSRPFTGRRKAPVDAALPAGSVHRRGRLVRQALVFADGLGLTVAFLLSTALFKHEPPDDFVSVRSELLLFLLTLPLWFVLASLYGLYERDEEWADHSTADEVFGVVNLVTLGTWMLFVATWASGLADPQLARLVSLWLLAMLTILSFRAAARSLCRRSALYVQRALIVGAGYVGQLLARKILLHPEYGLQLVGFVDDDPRASRPEIGAVPVLGDLADLTRVVEERNVDRVIVAFSREPDARTMALIRALRDQDLIVDVVPRLFDLVGERSSIHAIEGLPLLALPPARLGRAPFAVKRAIDVVGALALLLVTAPLFMYIAVRIRLDSPGSILFRQTRLGLSMKPFTAYKFRTMWVGTDEDEHRDYIRQTMTPDAHVTSSGIYKLSRPGAITPFGHWLRKTSLDELPQLINVLRGEMSLVGPRPCIPYEAENFAPHQFERFLVPQGITGLWQVTARSNSTFGEALDMDVAYVRGWSLGLDLRLMLRTPFAILRQRKATA